MKGPDVGRDVKQKLNLGCGPHILPGFINSDITELYDGETGNKLDIAVFDATQEVPYKDLDFILVNHVLCTMNPNYAEAVLRNCYDALKVGGQILVIDVDMMKAYSAYHNKQPELFPINGGSLDYKFTMHLSGFGTRLSLYTKEYMREVLRKCGFINPISYRESEYDLRPKESLVVGATKGEQ